MPLFTSSQLLVSYLLCQTALKEIQLVEKPSNKKVTFIKRKCIPLLKTSAGSYIYEQLLEVAYLKLDRKLAEELLKFAQNHKDKLSARLYYETLALNHFLNLHPNEFVKYGIKALDNGSKNLRLIISLALTAEILQDPHTFYIAVEKLHQIGKPVKPFTDRFFYTQPFPLNEETLKIAEKLLKFQPEEGYFIAYSLLLEKFERYQEEERVLKESLKRFPNSSIIKKALIRFYIKRGKQKEALKLVSSPDLDKFYYSQLLENTKEFPKFKEISQEVLKKYPDSNILLKEVLVGYISYNYLEGLNSLEQLLLSDSKKLNEDKANLLSFILISKYNLTGNWQPSEKALIDKLYLNYPYNENLKLLRALKNIAEKKAKEAKVLLKDINVQEMEPYTATIYNAVATYMGLKSLNETLPKEEPILVDTFLKTLYWLDKKLYIQTVELLQNNAKNGDECLNYSSAAWLFGDLKLSLELSKSCLKRFKNNSNVLNSVGYIMLLVAPERYLEEAKNLIRKSLRIDPQNVDAYDSLGWAYYYEGDLKEALKWVEKAVKRTPNNLVANYHMAEILFHLNKPCKALKYLERAFREKKKLPWEPEPGIYKKMELLKKDLLKHCPK